MYTSINDSAIYDICFDAQQSDGDKVIRRW